MWQQGIIARDLWGGSSSFWDGSHGYLEPGINDTEARRVGRRQRSGAQRDASKPSLRLLFVKLLFIHLLQFYFNLASRRRAVPYDLPHSRESSAPAAGADPFSAGEEVCNLRNLRLLGTALSRPLRVQLRSSPQQFPRSNPPIAIVMIASNQQRIRSILFQVEFGMY